MSTADIIRAGAYVPRPGDWVTIRRWITPTTGERTLHSEHLGQIARMQPEADGWLIWLHGDTDRIFTGYQFLGAGPDGRSPASLVTEIAPAHHDGLRIPVSPDLALLLDASLCIVAEVSDPAAGGEVLRRVTVTDVDALKAALDTLHAAQHAAMDEAEEQAKAELAEALDAKRRAAGRLTRHEAVEWLIARQYSRGHAVSITGRLRDGLRWEAGDEPGMSYADGYWIVPASGSAP